uniref:Beta-hexosaminidase subunit alpha n=1 Tax=Sinocyclocheilus anshuiensis TaxID=1608454 RepID=A0A671QTG4_9TELE
MSHFGSHLSGAVVFNSGCGRFVGGAGGWSPLLFSFTYGRDSAAQTGCSVLDAAFKRYFSIIFPDFTTENVLQYMWSEPQPFVVSVSVKTRGCDGYPDEDSDESYTLSVSEGHAVLRSVSVWGALGGLESLSQLYFVMYFPRFEFRGLLLETSRHHLPPCYFEDSGSKLNVFHWHIVDDPSFPYQSRTFPDLSNKVEIFSSNICLFYFTFISGNGNSPGHTQSWGKGQPGLLTPCYKGSVPSGSFGPVDPTVDTTYKFMESQFCLQSNPNVRKFLEKMGFGKDLTGIILYGEVSGNVRVFKKTNAARVTQCLLLSQIPQDTVLEIWKGAKYQSELSRMTQAGHRVLLSAPWYINHISYTARTPTQYEQKKLVIGGEVAMWGEYADATNLTPRLWPRACAAAERLWSNEEKTLNTDLAFPRLQEFHCELVRYWKYVII